MGSHRTHALIGLGGLAVLAVALIPSGLAIRQSFVDTGLAACYESLGGARFLPAAEVKVCDGPLAAFRESAGGWRIFAMVLLCLPLLAGLSWGVPLGVRDTGRGWVPAIVGTLLAATAYALMLTWWLKPLASAGVPGGFDYLGFDLHGVAPIGYTLFAVALGILTGRLTRNLRPAVVATLIGFGGVRALVEFAARPLFLQPKARTVEIATAEILNPAAGDWVLHRSIVEGRYEFLVYHPGERFWLFQGIETAAFVALAAVLLLIASRRRSPQRSLDAATSDAATGDHR